MIEKVAAGAMRPAVPRILLIAALAAVVVAALTAAHAGAPYLFKHATLQSEIATQVRETTGLAIQSERARFDLLPRPHVTMAGVHVVDVSGSIHLDADRLSGDVRWLPLIVGRVELSAVTLQHPRLSVDLDRRSIKADSTIGRAVRMADVLPTGARRRLGSVTMVDGTVTLTGHALSTPIVMSDFNVTVDWRDLESPATITGSLQIQNTSAEIAGWIAQPSSLIRGERSTVALHLHSKPLDFTATGDLSRSLAISFKGHVMASAPSLDGLLAIFARDLPLPAPFANMALSSDATISADDGSLQSMDLQNLNFRSDGNVYEGTLAYVRGDKPLVSGTLATDQLTLAPFIDRAPRLLSADRQWSRKPFAPIRLNAVNLDLRISGLHMRMPPFGVDDAALSIMTRGDRLEIGLNEGKAYGGSVKGRASLGFGLGGLSLRGTATLADADLATLTWDAFGWQAASGSLSGSANLESEGDTPAALMSHLQGWAKGRAGEGEVFGIDLGRELLDGQRSATSEPIMLSGRTPYLNAIVGVHFANGTAVMDDGALRGPNASLTVAGSADLAGRKLDFQASIKPRALPKDDTADERTLQAKHFGLTGSFDHVVIVPETGTALPPPTSPAVP